MKSFLIHFPIFLSLLVALLFSILVWQVSPWFALGIWQALAAAVMLIIDGKNREKRYEKILKLVRRGKPLELLPYEKTICGYFIRLAVLRESGRSKV